MQNELRKLTQLATPIVVGQVSQMLFGLTDTIMIGHVGTVELAATAFANNVFTIFLVFGFGLTNAATPLISRAIGRADQYGARRILNDALLVSFAAGVFLTFVCLLMLFGFDHMGQAPAVAKEAKTFFAIVSLTIVPSLLYATLKLYLECLNRATVPMALAIAGLLLNAVFNYVLIFGLGPIPTMGVAGAALGTLLARLIMLAALASYVKWEATHRLFEKIPNAFAALSRPAVIRELVTLGIPSAFIVTFEVGAFASSAIIVGWMGVVPLAAHQVTLSLVSLSFMIPMGLGVAATIRVGNELGRNDFVSAKKAATVALVGAASVMAISAAILAMGRFFFPTLFTSDQAVIEYAATLIIVGALFQISDGVQVVGAGVLRSLKDVRWPLAITFTSYWILALPLGYLLAFHFAMGASGIWLGLSAGLTVAALALTIRFYRLLAKQERAHHGVG